MIVVSMTKCPPKLRGDLSKWLLEINTGVYVGHVNARVREALWKRICENIRDGQATMVYTTNTEQHMDFYVHNSSWGPVDLDGIKLMKHPDRLNYTSQNMLQNGFSNEAKRRMAKRRRRSLQTDSYVLLDIETTGLSVGNDSIIEVGAVEVKNGEIVDEYESLIKYEGDIPENICKMTGINKEMLSENGKELIVVLKELFEYISGKIVLIYNESFDIGFLKNNAERYDILFPDIKTRDVLIEAKRKIGDIDNYKLETIAEYLGISHKQKHRAIDDCKLLNEVYNKLNKI